MTSLRIENICLRASLEINAAIDADKDRRDVSSKAHLTGYLLSHFFIMPLGLPIGRGTNKSTTIVLFGGLLRIGFGYRGPILSHTRFLRRRSD